MTDLAALQNELKAAKEKWPDMKLGKAKKEAENFPYPVWCLMAVQQPPSAKAFDVLEIHLKFVIAGLEKGQTSIEVPSPEIPAVLQQKIAENVLEQWNKNIGKKAAPWGIIKTFDWAETNFSKLLQLLPECVGSYEGCDDSGATMRRFAISAPAAPVEEASEEEEEDEEDDAEAAAEFAARVQALLNSVDEVDSSGKKKLTPEEIEKRKREAAEMGEKAVMLSKKEREELNKSKQGKRQAKTGQAHRKFEGEGSVSKEDKKKKNDANVKKRFGLA
mmetsp:Transcript_152010/g.264908  ORF Transcript_152010/g.264908 Transcript_152010/m.264908 type:complete len:275 (-) Transcript_152010:77-901(-)